MNPVLYVLGTSNETSADIVLALEDIGVPARLLDAEDALDVLIAGDTALARLDVKQTLDGVEPGLLATLRLERRGVRVLNPVAALLAAHDKLRSARLLESAGVPHPRTALLGTEEAARIEPPVVLKPRFGSWGRDVWLCADAMELADKAREMSGRNWFLRHGAIVQEYVPVPRQDLRMLVAGRHVVGAATRIALPGEWRTNVSIGGTLEPVVPPPEAEALSVAAVVALGGDFMGVDLIADPAGGHLVLEVNAAAEFDDRYAIEGRDFFREIALGLGLLQDPVSAVA
jgi:RimK family alpha-L-glutamate ligase